VKGKLVVLPQDRFYDWLRSKYPWMFGWKAILVSLGLSAAVIAFGLWINPPSEVRKGLENQKKATAKIKLGH
jgi:hypothetical protein